MSRRAAPKAHSPAARSAEGIPVSAARGIVALLVAASFALCVPPVAGQAVAPQEAASAPGRLPLRQGGDEAGPFTALGPLIAVLGVAAIGLWFWVNLRGRGMAGGTPLARWGMTARGQGRIEVVERTALSPTSTLVLVRWDDTELLLAASAQGIAVLSQRKVGARPEAGEPPCA